MNLHSEDRGISLAMIGTEDLCRRVAAFIAAQHSDVKLHPGNYAEAWSVFSACRPEAVLIEIGWHYNAKIHTAMRSFLERLRDRSGEEIFIIAALTSPAHLSFGGDLLFAAGNDLTPSRLLNAFVAVAPSHMPSLPSLPAQVLDVLICLRHDLERRRTGKPPLPPLGTPGWAQSMADPQSRALWMRWLPRYASYTLSLIHI